MLSRQEAARAPGTNANRVSAVQTFLKFCHTHRWPPLYLTHQMMCMYIEYLNRLGLAPPTVRNSVGHIRIYLQLVGATPVASHFRVTRAVEATMRRKDYVKKERPPPSSQVIVSALQNIPHTRETQHVRAALLMIYYGAFRQGEVVPQTIAEFDPLRHLTRGDVTLHQDRLEIVIKAAKNLQRYDQRRKTTVYKADDPSLCLVAAIKTILTQSPTVRQDQPMFVFHGTTRPIPASYVRAQWKAALTRIGAPYEQHTLHTLRKAAVSNAYNSGVKEHQVQHYGLWASKAYKAYLYADEDQSVARVISSSLSHKS